MKTLFFSLAFISVTTLSFAQHRPEAQASQDALVGTKQWVSPPLPMQGSSIVYEEAVDVPNKLSKEILFKNALEWYNYNYKTGDTRLTVENQATGKISGTGVIKYTPAAAGGTNEIPIFFEFDLLIAEGKYSYKFYDMYSIDNTGKFLYADMYREDRNKSTQLSPRWGVRYRYELLSDMNSMIESAIVHLKQAMQMNSGVATK